jgi:ABC-type cobalamin/Fe3+-siderophores transport system ATPase subunit
MTKADPLPESTSILLRHIKASMTDGKRLKVALMGPNGSGKTRLLKALSDHLGNTATAGNIKKTYISVAQRIGLKQELFVGMHGQAPGPLGDPKDTADLRAQRELGAAMQLPGGNDISLREALGRYIARAFETSQREREEEGRRYVTWARNGKVGLEPALSAEPNSAFRTLILEVLGYDVSVKHEILPIPEVGVNNTKIEISFIKDGRNIGIVDLSDGEHQLLLMLVLLLSEGAEKHVVLVDEPELFLHDRRAVEVWSRIERALPTATFVYATHSLTFATRPEIDAIFTIGQEQCIARFDPEQGLTDSVVRDTIDARILLLRSGKPVIFCEDDAHVELLKGLLGPVVQIQKQNSFSGVRAAVKGNWTRDAMAVQPLLCCGVVDRDARSEEQILDLRANGVFALPFFDSEATMLHPLVVKQWLSGGVGACFDEGGYIAVLRQAATALETKSLHLFIGQYDYKGLANRICNSADSAEQALGDIVAAFDISLTEQYQAFRDDLRKIIVSGSYEAILARISGKALLRQALPDLSGRLGLKNAPQKFAWPENPRTAADLCEALRSVPELIELRDSILVHLNIPAA